LVRALSLLGLVVLLTLAPAAEAQTPQRDSAATLSPTERLLSRLADQRFRAVSSQLIGAMGERPVGRPATTLPLWDSLLAVVRPPQTEAVEAEPAPVREPFVIGSVTSISKLTIPWFLDRFAGTSWAYLGSEQLTTLDTTRTWRLRAALERLYDRPTETVVEKALEARERGERLNTSTSLQFGYWFVVNGEIPVVVTDVSGPLDRGLVMASDAALGVDQLMGLREALLEPLAVAAQDAESLAPYVDLFYDAEAGRWYRAGYDGFRFRIEAIRAPNLRLGRPYRFTD
jgi:hypothetical protein